MFQLENDPNHQCKLRYEADLRSTCDTAQKSRQQLRKKISKEKNDRKTRSV